MGKENALVALSEESRHIFEGARDHARKDEIEGQREFPVVFGVVNEEAQVWRNAIYELVGKELRSIGQAHKAG